MGRLLCSGDKPTSSQMPPSHTSSHPLPASGAAPSACFLGPQSKPERVLYSPRGDGPSAFWVIRLRGRPWLGVRDIVDPCPQGAFFLAGETDNKEVSRQMRDVSLGCTWGWISWDVQGAREVQLGSCPLGTHCLLGEEQVCRAGKIDQILKHILKP